ncbi:MAG: hypothetical protein VKJ09_14700 [Leptolyngbya sp.]|nr:hypothetical protein [Leptolyngbya sp.]
MSKSRLWSWALFAAGFWTAGFIYNVYIGGYPSWLRTMYHRKAALAQEIEQPKVIIAGGSGAHYTINSDVMEAALGMPVMNLGSNGGVGLNVLLPSVIEDVNPGDIMLLIPEYPLLLDNDGVDDLSATFSFMIGRPGVGNIPAKDLAQNAMTLGIPSLAALVKTGKDLVQEGRVDYYGDPLTQRGDATIELSRQSDWWPMTIGEPISDYALQRIAQFKEEVEARGGTLVLSLPWIYAKTEGKTVDNIRATAEALAEIAPVLYDPATLNIQASPDMFADTHYHLKIPARVVRSQQLAEELEVLLPQLSTTPAN